MGLFGSFICPVSVGDNDQETEEWQYERNVYSWHA